MRSRTVSVPVPVAGQSKCLIASVRAQVQAGKVRKAEPYSRRSPTATCCRPTKKPPARAKLKPAVLARYRKLKSELDGARISLTFVQTAVIYNDETRPPAIERVQLIIANVEKQLAQLVG